MNQIEWSEVSLALGGVPCPVQSLSYHPDDPALHRKYAPTSGTVSFRIKLRHLDDLLWKAIVGLEPWFDRYRRHILNGCGPGGHRNSKASRRLQRAIL